VSQRTITVRVIRFSTVRITPPLFHTHLRVYVSVRGRKSGRSLGDYKNFNGNRGRFVESFCKFVVVLKGWAYSELYSGYLHDKS